MRTWLVVMFAVMGCNRDVRPQPVATQASELSIFITAELRGYVGPCGCSESMRGGIDRLAALVQQTKTQGRSVVFIDSGNTLFGSTTVPDEAIRQQVLKAKTIAETFKLLDVSGVGQGPLDLAQGKEFVSSLSLPRLPADTVTRFPKQPSIAVIRSATPETIFKLASAARLERTPFIIGLYEASYEDAVKLALRDGLELDLIIATRAKDELSAEDNRLVMTRVPVVQVQSKGRSVARVDLFHRDDSRVQWLKSPTETQRELAALSDRIELLRAQVNDPSLDPSLAELKRLKLDEVIARKEALANERVPVPTTGNAASVRLVPLETSFPTLPEATALLTEYDRNVGILNLDWAKQFGKACDEPAMGQAGYVGTSTCAACHPHADAVLRQTKHGHAYEVLVAKGKNYHLDCVGCHVTGWKAPGGVCRIDEASTRANVGCEACHGPGSLHAVSPSAQKLARGTQACVGCHDRENSPHFSLDAYLPQILGPGHGQPLPTPTVGGVK